LVETKKALIRLKKKQFQDFHFPERKLENIKRNGKPHYLTTSEDGSSYRTNPMMLVGVMSAMMMTTTMMMLRDYHLFLNICHYRRALRFPLAFLRTNW